MMQFVCLQDQVFWLMMQMCVGHTPFNFPTQPTMILRKGWLWKNGLEDISPLAPIFALVLHSACVSFSVPPSMTYFTFYGVARKPVSYSSWFRVGVLNYLGIVCMGITQVGDDYWYCPSPTWKKVGNARPLIQNLSTPMNGKIGWSIIIRVPTGFSKIVDPPLNERVAAA